MPTAHTSVLGLDVGDKRVGVAVATLAARLPRPLTTLERSEGFFEALEALVRSEDAGALVVGLPRNLRGEHTDQTRSVEKLVQQLQERIGISIHLQDEAATSKQAEAELEARKKPYAKGDIDALAATYILQDWLSEHPSEQGAA
jgi:putative Holliday junction resolvase